MGSTGVGSTGASHLDLEGVMNILLSRLLSRLGLLRQADQPRHCARLEKLSLMRGCSDTRSVACHHR
eukprot:577782-Pyramimonas_sp.AAC.1